MATDTLPAYVDLKAYRGDTWEQTFRLLEDDAPVDLTAATITAQAASAHGERIDLDTDPGGPDGIVTIRLPASGVAAGDYQYDIEIILDGVVTTWVRGRLAITQDITNPTALAAAHV